MPEGLETIVPRYLAARRDEVPEMLALLAASDFDRLASLAHKIKGTGTSYGFLELTQMAARAELSAKKKDAETLTAELAEIQDYLGRVRLSAKP
jgi:HPt (histidine-containing phosphotransfer) domain-containing protein